MIKEIIERTLVEAEEIVTKIDSEEYVDENEVLDKVQSARDFFSDLESDPDHDYSKDIASFKRRISKIEKKLGYISQEELDKEMDNMFPDEDSMEGFNWTMD